MKILAALLLTATPLLGCAGKSEQPHSGPPTDSRTQTIEISYDDLLNEKQIKRDISMKVGDFLQVSLGSNASTGYRWAEQMQISDPTVLVQTGRETIAPKGGQPGAAGSEVWMLQATAPGTSAVSTTYSRPWEGGEKDVWSFNAEVTVN